MGRNEGFVVGLDIGTTKICCVVAELRPGDNVHVVGLAEAPSRGLRKGVVVNPDATVADLCEFVKGPDFPTGCFCKTENTCLSCF